MTSIQMSRAWKASLAMVLLLSTTCVDAKEKLARIQCGSKVCEPGQTCVEGCGSFSCEGNSLPKLAPKVLNCGGIRVTFQNMTVTITPEQVTKPEGAKPTR